MGKLLDVTATLEAAHVAHAAAEAGRFGVAGLAGDAGAAGDGVAGIIEAIKHHTTTAFFTDGAWSMHELVEALLRSYDTMPMNVWIATYAMSETAARCLARLKEEKVINELRVILDSRSEMRSAGALAFIQSIADEFALVPSHAKVTMIDAWAKPMLHVVGSANYTENKRLESGLVVRSNALFELHHRWFRKTFDEYGR